MSILLKFTLQLTITMLLFGLILYANLAGAEGCQPFGYDSRGYGNWQNQQQHHDFNSEQHYEDYVRNLEKQGQPDWVIDSARNSLKLNREKREYSRRHHEFYGPSNQYGSPNGSPGPAVRHKGGCGYQ